MKLSQFYLLLSNLKIFLDKKSAAKQDWACREKDKLTLQLRFSPGASRQPVSKFEMMKELISDSYLRPSHRTQAPSVLIRIILSDAAL